MAGAQTHNNCLTFRSIPNCNVIHDIKTLMLLIGFTYDINSGNRIFYHSKFQLIFTKNLKPIKKLL